MTYRTFRYRLHPTYHQVIALEKQLGLQRELYNAALQERLGAWEWERRSVSYIDQCKTLSTLSDVRPDVVASGITLCRGTLKRLDRAFGGFYRRVKRGESPGFPRFRSAQRWDSLQWEDRTGWKLIDTNRLRLMGIGDIKMNYCRSLTGHPKAITVKREGKKWWLSVRCADVFISPLLPTRREVGIDLGVVNVITTSDGEFILGEHFGAQAADKLAKAQRSLSTKQRGSNRRKRQVENVARLYRRVANQRKNAAHKLSRQLVNDFDLIVYENLTIKNMVRAPKPKMNPNSMGEFLPNGRTRKAALNNSIHDAGWGNLVSMISYKAECAGRTVMSVDPAYTSQRCFECGHIESANRISQAVFHCQSCGHENHADVNAARNILRAGRAQLALASVS